MSSRPRLFEDVSRLAGDAATAIGGLKSEVEAAVKQRFERMLADLDLVPREEFETVRAMAAAAREEQERLAARVAQLEAALKAKPAAEKKPAAAKKPAAKKPAAKKPAAKPTPAPEA